MTIHLVTMRNLADDIISSRAPERQSTPVRPRRVSASA